MDDSRLSAKTYEAKNCVSELSVTGYDVLNCRPRALHHTTNVNANCVHSSWYQPLSTNSECEVRKLKWSLVFWERQLAVDASENKCPTSLSMLQDPNGRIQAHTFPLLCGKPADS